VVGEFLKQKGPGSLPGLLHSASCFDEGGPEVRLTAGLVPVIAFHSDAAFLKRKEDAS